jgi:hypothetical protein
MTAPEGVDPAGWLDDQLASASPDLLRNMVETFADAVMSADADQLCGAEYGVRSPERTNSRRRLPVAGLGHPRRDRGAGGAEAPVRLISSGLDADPPPPRSAGAGGRSRHQLPAGCLDSARGETQPSNSASRACRSRRCLRWQPTWMPRSKRSASGEGGGHDVLGGLSLSALSESSSTSACAFPMMPSANRVFARSDSNFSFRRRSFSNSISSADFFPRVAGATDSAESPDKTPASRARVHSTIWEEYRPSRRRTAPFSPLGAFSYAATTASLYAGVNTPRVGRGAGSLPPARTPDCLSDGEDTRTRISGPALPIRDPTLTRGVSHHPAGEPTTRPPHRSSHQPKASPTPQGLHRYL